ncbi:protein FAM200B [Octopus bimaculoides]|uniref:protein FAM200B n=1 Tax=Octopus bimaculoides TaxID=37653 RepID=UPI00071D6208|nr:protein FAM200B [Octopus bimaculoides]|eukprot:XP_014768815.1 PREDICTED: protein FAM200B-like [Octopus bimaculoides]
MPKIESEPNSLIPIYGSLPVSFRFINQEEMEASVKEFFASKGQELESAWIKELEERWFQTVQHDGFYFERCKRYPWINFCLKRNAHDEINSESDTETEEIVQKNKLRKYDVEYIRFGFIESVSNANRPQCLLCHKLLSNEALKPAKLQRHLTTLHPQFATNPKDFFERKKDAYLKETITFKMSITSNYKLLRASYLVALRVARAKKAHNIAEELVLPGAIDICEAVLDGKCAAKLKAVPLSDNTIARKLEDMSKYIKSQLIDRVKTSFFALQLDESTDITSVSQLMVYVRYCWESEMLEDFLSCYPMPTRTTGEEVFKVLDSFLFQSGLLWSRCIGICTDGVASMIGIHSGVVGYIKKVAPNITATHCMIHREALVAKKMDASLPEVLSCIKVINFIKKRPLYSRFFVILCGEMGDEHSSLLLHTEVR